MGGGVNAWRFQLAEEEEKRRRKFGWDDLFDLLQTAAGGYAAVKGVQEAGKRTALAEEKFGYEQEQDVLRETARQGTAMRGMEEAGYERVPTLTGGYGDAAKAAQMGGDMGRVHPDLGDTAWRAPPSEPTPEELLQQEITGRQALGEAAEARGGAPGQVFGGDQWHYPPGTGQGTVETGPSEPDIDRYMRRAKDIADRHAYAQAYKGGEGYLDPMANNAPNQGHPEWQQVYNSALQDMLGGGADIEEEPVPDLLPNLVELAMGNIRGDPEDIAGLTGLRELEPGVAAVVDSMIAQIEAAGAGTAGGKIGGLFGMLGQGMNLAERAVALPGQASESLAALPGRVQAVPGAISERAEDVSEAAWPLKALWQLLGR